MTGRRRGSADGELWRRATQDVTPIGKRTPRAAKPPPDPPAPPSPPPAAPAPVPPPAPRKRTVRPPLEPGAAIGVDARSVERLKRGQLPIEARLDLHGMTQAEAHGALDAFLDGSTRRGRRSVLVVTGRGGRGSEGPGVLRRMVPRWLNEPANRDRLLAFAEAQPKDGGAGALYLLLRKRR